MSDMLSIPLDIVYDCRKSMRPYRHRVGRRLQQWAFNYKIDGVFTELPLYMYVWSVNYSSAKRAAKRRIAYEVKQIWGDYKWYIYDGSLVKPFPKYKPIRGNKRQAEALASFVSPMILQIIEDAPPFSNLFNTLPHAP